MNSPKEPSDKGTSLPTLWVADEHGRQRFTLDPKGTVIGRNPECAVLLDHPQVSRNHARIYADPFGRWILEDLGSRNGTWINGVRIEAQPINSGERIAIEPFVLEIATPEFDVDSASTRLSVGSMPDSSEQGTLVRSHRHQQTVLSSRRLQDIDRLSNELSGVSRARDLYPLLCRFLTREPDTVALVLRLDEQEQLPAKVISSHCNSAIGSGESQVLLSSRVLDSVRQSGQAAMASNLTAAPGDLNLTVVNQSRPRTVACAPVSDEDNEVLYVDGPADSTAGDALDYLRAVARLAGFARRSLLVAEESAKRQILEEQLATARTLQSHLIPSSLSIAPGVDFALRYVPAMWVGGDYCDLWRLPDGRVSLALGDVSGKGLSAALAMTNLQAALRMVMRFCNEPAVAITELNQHLMRILPSGMFVTLLLALLDPDSGRLDYVNAGHILPIRLRDGRASELGAPSNPPLGIVPHDYGAERAQLHSREQLLLVTDGVTEARSDHGELFGPQRLSEVVALYRGHDSEQLVEAVIKSVESFRGKAPQRDDLTVLVVTRTDFEMTESL